MKHLTDQIRNISNDLINYYNKVNWQVNRNNNTLVRNEINNKSLLLPSMNVSTHRTKHYMDDYDYIHEDALPILEKGRQVVWDGKQMLLAVLVDEVVIEGPGMTRGGKSFLGHHFQEQGDKEHSTIHYAHSLIIKDDIGYVKNIKRVRENNISVSAETSLLLATKKDLVDILHTLIDAY